MKQKTEMQEVSFDVNPNDKKTAQQLIKEERALSYLLSKPLSPLQVSWLGFLKKRKFTYFMNLTANFNIGQFHLAAKLEEYFLSILSISPKARDGSIKKVVEFYYAVEKDPSNISGYHAHGLIKVSGSIDAETLKKMWVELMNNGKSRKFHESRIEPIRNIRDVANYTVKDIAKPITHYDFLSSETFLKKGLERNSK